MSSKLKYIPGAVPGKVGKRKAAAPGDIAKKHRVGYMRLLAETDHFWKNLWKIGREWLEFDESKMTCKWCIKAYPDAAQGGGGEQQRPLLLLLLIVVA